jgi:ribosomal protein S17
MTATLGREVEVASNPVGEAVETAMAYALVVAMRQRKARRLYERQTQRQKQMRAVRLRRHP